MSRVLPVSVILEKNKLASPNPFLLFLDVQVGSGEGDWVYLVRNTENKFLGAQEYTAFPFEVDTTIDTSKGDIPSLTLRVSNVTRVLEAYLEELDGLIEKQIVLRLINAANLDDVAIELTYDIIGTNYDENWVYFTLGAPSPLRKRFPRYKFIAKYCNWVPGGLECGKSAAIGVCRRTYEDCHDTYSNTPRFGGYLGLSNPSVRLA